MKKVLIFPYSNQLGTTIPSITLANMLRDNGYKVEFASRGNYTFVIEEKGYKVHDVPEISYMHYREYLDKNRMDYYDEHLIRAFVDYEVSLIEELDPDIVVGHNRPSLYISTQLTKKKYVNLTVGSLTRFYNQHLYIPENHALNRFLPFINANLILPNGVINYVYHKTMREFVKGINSVLIKKGLQPLESFLDTSNADLVLLVETYGLVNLKSLPKNYYYLEQNTDSGFGHDVSARDEILLQKKSGKKVIGISMGTSAYEAYPLVLKSLVEYVLGREDLILVSNHCGLEKEYKTNRKIYIEEFINPKDLLTLSDIVITHGGKNTLNEAIMARKLVIGIPEQAEQLWNLKYAESLGIAQVLSRFKLKTNKNILLDTIRLFEEKAERSSNRIDSFVSEVIEKRDRIDHVESILGGFSSLL